MQAFFSDYLIIGSGLAGLFCALKARLHGRVTLLTRGDVLDGNTALAQGGIAAAVGPGDSPELHFQDTVQAGAGACDPAAVTVLVREGIGRLRELADMGVPFDTRADGRFRVAREAAHSLARVIPAQGDGTGLAVARALAAQAARVGDIQLREHTRALEILSQHGRALGALAVDRRGSPQAYLARGVVLATGGLGRLYARSTASRYCNGEALAMAYRAGAVLADLEFMQFHPTALDVGEDPLPLVSEAVRGHGALLVDEGGRRFMPAYHPWAELAPRDVVARAIFAEERQGHRVFLDTTPLKDFAQRFPAIHRICRRRGLDPLLAPLPVTPAAHFSMGGVLTDLRASTRVRGLFACGEAARTGVHGANRLASNSLLEGLVFSHRAAGALAGCPAPPAGWARRDRLSEEELAVLLPPGRLLSQCLPGSRASNGEGTARLRRVMWELVGVMRRAEGLRQALALMAELAGETSSTDLDLANQLQLARLTAQAALDRRESRGGHYRSDFPRSRAELARHTFTYRRDEAVHEPLVAGRHG